MATMPPAQLAWALLNLMRGVWPSEVSTAMALTVLHVWHTEPSMAEHLAGPHEPGSVVATDLMRRFRGMEDLHRNLGGDTRHAEAVLLDSFRLLRGCDRSLAAETFEEVLITQRHGEGRHSGESLTPEGINRLAVGLASIGGGSVFDPACGAGGSLVAAAKAGASEVVGCDINERTVSIARMRLDVHDVKGRVVRGDAFDRPVSGRFSAVICDPPFGMQLSDAQFHQIDQRLRRSDGAGAWFLTCLESVALDGVAVVSAAAGALWRPGALEALVAQGFVESIVLLPAGARSIARIATSLVVLRKKPQPQRSVLYVDAGSLFEQADSGIRLPEPQVDELVNIVNAWRLEDSSPTRGDVAMVIPRDTAASRDFVPQFPKAPAPTVVWPDPVAQLLRGIRIANVKSLGGQHHVPLAPITLVYGPNSVGKSTVLQALGFLLQSLHAGEIAPNGPLARLGSLMSMATAHDPDAKVRVGIDFGIVPPWPAASGSLHPRLLRSVDLEACAADGSGVQIGVGLGGDSQLVATRSDAKAKWRLSVDSIDAFIQQLESPDGAFLDPRKGTIDYSKYKRLSQVVRTVRRRAAGSVEDSSAGLIPTSFTMPQLGGVTIRDGELLEVPLNRALRSVDAEARQLAQDCIYLGPIRPAPQRFAERVMSSGSPGGSPDFAPYLFENAAAVDQVNVWLERLGIPYKLKILALSVGGSPAPVGDLLGVVLQDRRSGVEVTPVDVGYGVSQVLPIIVQCVVATAKVICIEQPELHLHPRLQANLGELFWESTSAAGAANQVIVETHSEHLLLRLQRLVRQGTIPPDHLSVLYVEQDDAGSTSVSKLRLGAQGELLDPWPAGFFDDSLDDVLGGWE